MRSGPRRMSEWRPRAAPEAEVRRCVASDVSPGVAVASTRD